MSAQTKGSVRMRSAYSVIEGAGLAEVVKAPQGNARRNVELADMARALLYQKGRKNHFMDLLDSFTSLRSSEIAIILCLNDCYIV